MQPATIEPPHHTDGPERFQTITRLILVVALVVFGVWTLENFVRALVWAAVMAIAVWPLYTMAVLRWPPGKHNILLPLLFTLGVALIFVLPLVLGAVQVAREFHNIAEWYAKAEANGLPVPGFVANLPIGAKPITDWWNANLANPHGLTEIFHKLDRDSVIGYGRSAATKVARSGVEFAFTLVTLFFILRDNKHLSEQLLTAGHRLVGPSGERLGRQIMASVRGTVDGLVLVGLAEGVFLGIGYWIAGVPHPTIFGAISAIAAIIPFGAPVLFFIAAFTLLVQGSVAAAIGIIAFGFVVTFVADHVVRPVMIGGATRLPFLWVLLGILGGLETWGLLGLFLGPAVMAALILLWRELTEAKQGAEAEGDRAGARAAVVT